MDIQKQKHTITVMILSVVLLGGLFITTAPEAVPPILLLVVFGLIYSLIASTGLLLARLAKNAGNFKWSDKNIRRIVLGASLLPTFLLILQSIGQLTTQDILLTAGLSVLAYLYYQRLIVKAPSSS